jgi:hypothetical protein
VFANVFGPNFLIDNVHIDELFPGKKYSREKFTFQNVGPPDHRIQIKTDIEGSRLNQIVLQGRSESTHRERLTKVKCLLAKTFGV